MKLRPLVLASLAFFAAGLACSTESPPPDNHVADGGSGGGGSGGTGGSGGSLPILDAARSTVSASPDSAIADGSDAVEILVKALDLEGTPIAGAEVVLASSREDDDLEQPAPTDAEGIALGRLRSTVAGIRTVTATVGGTPLEQRATVTFSPGSATALAFLTAPGTAVAGLPHQPAIRVGVVDAHGNLVAAPAVEVGLSILGVSIATAGTADGIAAFADVRLDHAGVGLRYVASSAGLEDATSDAFDVVSGAAARLTFHAEPPAELEAGGTFSVTVAVHDGFGNPADAATVDVGLVIAGGSPDAVLAGPAQVRPEGGMVTFYGLGIERAGVGFRLVAQAPGLEGAESPAFDVIPGPTSSATSTWTATPPAARGDGVDEVVLALATRDGFGNPVAGAVAALAVDGGDANLRDASLVSDEGGAASTSVTAIGGGDRTVTARVDDSFDLSVTVFFVMGVPDEMASSLTIESPSVLADGATTATIRAEILDQDGEPVVGLPVSFSSSGTANTFVGGNTKTTDAGGVATISLRSTKAERKTVTATAGSIAVEADVDFVAGPPSAARSIRVSGFNQTGIAGAPLAAPFVVRILDAHDNPVPGATVDFAVTQGGGSLSAAQVQTDAAGDASATLTLGTTAGTNAVSASAWSGASPLVFSVPGTSGPPALATVIQGDLQSGIVGTALPVLLGARFADAHGNIIVGELVSFATSSIDGSFSDLTAATDGSGEAFVSYTLGTVAEPQAVTMYIGTAQAEFTLTGEAGAAASIDLISGDGQVGSVNALLPDLIQVRVLDAYGNGVPNHLLRLNTVSGSGYGEPRDFTTGADGIGATNYRAGTSPGSFSARVDSLASPGLAGAPISFFVNGGPPMFVNSVASPNNGTVGETLVDGIQVKVVDISGNGVAGVTVNFTVSSGGGSITPASAVTDTSGIARASPTLGTTRGLQTFVATTPVLPSETKNFNINAVAGPVATIVKLNDNQSGPVGSVRYFEYRLEDQFGNSIGGYHPVPYSVTSGGGSVSPASGWTDGSGEDGVSFTIGSLGTNTFTATANGVTVTFTATGVP